MTSLSTRAEQAKPDEARGLLEELWDELAPKLWPKVTHDLHCRAETFARLLDINTPEAHLAAAMMLVPEGYTGAVGFSAPYACGAHLFAPGGAMFKASDCQSPALALIAAISKAIGQ